MKPLLIFALLFFGYSNISCNKNQPVAPDSIAIGTIIGFDPCTAQIPDYSKRGYVIKIQAEVDSGKNVELDTAATYNLPSVLPGIFGFNPTFFQQAPQGYLFPFVSTFQFRFTYRYASESELKSIACLAIIYTAGFDYATEGKQIIITGFYGVIPSSEEVN